MLYPMLVGRTALGNGVVVDPARRRLLPDMHLSAGSKGAAPRNGHKPVGQGRGSSKKGSQLVPSRVMTPGRRARGAPESLQNPWLLDP